MKTIPILTKRYTLLFFACIFFWQLSATIQAQSPGNIIVSGIGETLQDRLLSEVKRQNLPAVRDLIAQGANVNITEVDGSTPLLWAIYQNDEATVDALLAAGADVNAGNRYGITPFLQAIRVGNSDIAMSLLDAGVDPSPSTTTLESPFMAAARNGMTEVVSRLIEEGADVNQTEPIQGQTALMWAADQGHAPVIEILLEAGADPNLTGVILLDYLSRERGEGSAMDFPAGGLTALMFAARQGHFEAAKTLVEAGADISYRNPEGITALLMAVLNDRLDLAAMLIDYGANPNDGSMYELVSLHDQVIGPTPIDETRVFPDQENEITPTELMTLMLAVGADPNFIPDYTLHADSRGGLPDVNGSPYRYVLFSKDIAMIRLMLESGMVDANFVSEGEAPPLNVFLNDRGERRLGFFVPSGDWVLRFPSSHDINEGFALLLEHGADVNQASEQGDTPLHIAAMVNRVEIIRELYANGADLEAENAAGLTALDLAMGERAPDTGGGGRGGRGGPPAPNPEAIAVLRELMGLPTSAENAQ